jgi:hypothetical protein
MTHVRVSVPAILTISQTQIGKYDLVGSKRTCEIQRRRLTLGFYKTPEHTPLFDQFSMSENVACSL